VTTSGTFGIFTVNISTSTGQVTLTAWANPGDAVLPTTANYIAHFVNTTGSISSAAANVTNPGNISAGLSGTAGIVSSFPATGSKGSLALTAVANTGNTVTTISNDAMGQASVINIPDPANAIGQLLIGATATPFVSGNFPKNSGTAGLMVDSGIAVSALASTANVVVLAPTADQTITAHNLIVSQGNLQAGSSGHAGTVESFPAAASEGGLILAAVSNSSGDFNTTISNAAAVAQSQVISIPDVGATTGQFLVKTAALVSGNFIQASGTAGVVIDSGIAKAPSAGVIGVPYLATVTMNTAAVVGAYATPFQIIAAPGASLAIIVLNASIITEVSTPFATGGIGQIQYGNTNHAGGTICTSATIPAAEITAASSQIYTMAPIAAATVMATATFKNLGIFFTNDTGAYTNGTGSTVTVAISYMLVPAV
jgi:hypothetical protein